MRLIPAFFAALTILTSIAGCGTKTPLSLPPQAQPAAKAAVPPAADGKAPARAPAPLVDDSNKAADPRP
jgi:predicted small lipoprotein YifL